MQRKKVLSRKVRCSNNMKHWTRQMLQMTPWTATVLHVRRRAAAPCARAALRTAPKAQVPAAVAQEVTAAAAVQQRATALMWHRPLACSREWHVAPRRCMRDTLTSPRCWRLTARARMSKVTSTTASAVLRSGAVQQMLGMKARLKRTVSARTTARMLEWVKQTMTTSSDQSNVLNLASAAGLTVATVQLAVLSVTTGDEWAARHTADSAQAHTTEYYTPPPPPVPSAGLAQQALEADALRVRQGSQLIFFLFWHCLFYIRQTQTNMQICAIEFAAPLQGRQNSPLLASVSCPAETHAKHAPTQLFNREPHHILMSNILLKSVPAQGACQLAFQVAVSMVTERVMAAIANVLMSGHGVDKVSRYVIHPVV